MALRYRDKFLGKFLLPLLFILAACEPADLIVARQVVVEWPEQHLVFVADSRLGRVQSYRTEGAGPLLLAQTPGLLRSNVRDIRLVPLRNQLWVLGGNGVYLYEARGLALQKHYPLDARKVSVLRIDAGRVLLVDKSGEPVGQIDSETLVASWRQAASRS
jgi:hypothetical protein